MYHRKRPAAWKTLTAALALILFIGTLLSGCSGTKRVAKETEETTFGIDVARYQGTIDWSLVAQSGVDFAMIRAGSRSMSDGTIEEDSNARYNLQEGAKAGISLGAYFFSTALNEEEAREEAHWVAQLLAQYPITYPVVYDCERFREPESRQYGMSVEERTDAALAFLETIESYGYEGMFYGAKNELESFWDMERLQEDYKIWVAQYPAEPYPQTEKSDYAGVHHMWQYTNEGSVPGIDPAVDLNVAYFGYDGVEPAKDPTPPEEVGPDVEALMNFTPAEQEVTAKDVVNLRNMPSTDHVLSQIIGQLNHGDVAQCTAVSDSGWSRLTYNGQTCYAVTSYLMTPGEAAPEEEGTEIQTQFADADQQVTAKDVVNLRSIPSVEREDVQVIGQLKNGETAQCTGVSDNGWSRLVWNDQTCYAISSYLIPAGTEETQAQTEPEGIQTQFEEVNEQVTPKIEVNLRSLPSVEDPECVVVATIRNGEVVTRTGINRDLGWSRVVYNGQTLYCVSSYLTAAE